MATSNSAYAFNLPPILPIDVLCEIFKTYIGDYYHTRSFSLMRRPQDVPWFLSHICRQWRIAAIATPQLWKRFPPLRLTTKDDTPRNYPMFDELLNRSGAHLIRVQFEFACKEGNADVEAMLLTPLLATSRRWEEVTVWCPFQRTVGSLFDGIEGHIPHLRRVELLLLDENKSAGEEAPEKLAKIFCKTPMLSELFLQTLPLSFPTLAVPWEQLTKLQWDYGEGIYDALKYAKNLDTLMVIECESFGDTDPPMLEHPKLRRLDIRVQENRNFLTLLDNLKLPALEVLVITHHPNWPYMYWGLVPILIPFFVRSECDLKHLVLDAGDLEDSNLMGILEVTPNLETLEIGPDCADLNEIFLWLVFEETRETLLPYLHTLTLLFPFKINAQQVAMIKDIVESRNRVVLEGEDSVGRLFSPLQNVCVRIGDLDFRFQACLDLNGEEVDTPYTQFISTTKRFRHLECMPPKHFEQTIVTLDERKIAEVFRHRHAFGQLYKGYDFLLRKTCQSLVTEDFISSLKWMLVGEDDIVYIRPDHELRNSANRWNIAFGMYGELELLKEYNDSEIFAEPRVWWNCDAPPTRKRFP